MTIILIEVFAIAAVAVILHAIRGKIRFFRGGYIVRRDSYKEDERIQLIVEDMKFFTRKERDTRVLRMDGSGVLYSRIPLNKESNALLVYSYCAPLLSMLKGIGATPERTLVLGGGGGAVPLHLLRSYERVSVDVVEICAESIRITKSLFLPDYAQDGGRLNFVHNDAKNAVKALSPAYQFIFCDLYAGGVPAEIMYNPDFMRDISRLAGTDGLLVVNGGSFSPKGVFVLLRNLHAAFAKAWVMLLSDGFVLLARNSEMPSLDNLLLNGQGIVPIYPSPYTEEALRDTTGEADWPRS